MSSEQTVGQNMDLPWFLELKFFFSFSSDFSMWKTHFGHIWHSANIENWISEERFGARTKRVLELFEMNFFFVSERFEKKKKVSLFHKFQK